MKNRGPWLAIVACLAAVIACGSGNNNGNSGGGGSFPYSGPSCTSNTINDACWSCIQSSCNGSCITSDCSGYFDCFCSCAQGDTNCYQGCQNSLTPACTSCVDGLTSCVEGTCRAACTTTGSSGGSSGGVGSSSGPTGSSSGPTGCVGCGGLAQECPNGSTMEFCQVGCNGCTSAYYQVGGQTFACTSCTDISSCEQQAQAACGNVVDAEPPLDAGPPDSTPFDVGPVPDAPEVDGGATCHAVPCGTMGQSMSYCEMDDGPNGACTAAWYEVGAQVFQCSSCSTAGCQTAAQEASKACP